MIARRLLAALAIVTALIEAHPLAQTTFTKEELTVSPYQLVHGSRPTSERIARHRALAVIAEQGGDLPRAARHWSLACAGVASKTGDVNFTAEPCERARQLAEQHDITDVKIHRLVAKGAIQAWTFNFMGASATLNQAIEMSKGLDPDLPENQPVISAHHMLGAASVEIGQFDHARKELTYARDHCRASRNAQCAANADLGLCRLHTMVGDFEAARTACDSGTVEASVDNDVVTKANVGWMRGFLEFNLNRPQQALNALGPAWTASQVEGAEILQPILAQMMVDNLLMLGRLDEADKWQADIDKGLKDGRIPFFFGPQVAMRRGMLAAARFKLDEAETAFMAASRSLIQEMAIRGTIMAARINRIQGEFDKSQALLESAIRRVESARTNVAGSALRTSYLGFHAYAYRELAGVHFQKDKDASAPKVLEISEAGRARALLDSLASAQAVGVTAPTLTASAVQQTLRPEDVLIEYVSSDDRLIAVTVTRDRIAITNLLGATLQSQLARRVEFFSTLVQESDEAALKPAARRLYDDLLAPALKDVPSTARTLIIAADGPLHGLPFDAIGDPPVLDRWNVVLVPSASALASRAPRARPTGAALVVAAPPTVPGLAQLTAAPIEADTVRSRIGGRVEELSGATATEARLMSVKPEEYAVLHFASHALVDEERPLRSALLLGADPGANDGRWTAEEIYRSKLHADLVVLSACSTAAGAQAAGEGVMSLSRAFLSAGAGATIATLWDVPDAPGPVFADVLYRGLTNGETLGMAASDARRELRRRGAPPRTWAAYVLTGNPAAHVGIAARTPARLMAARVAGTIAVVFLVLAAIVAMARRGNMRRPRVRWAPLVTASMLFAVVAMGLQLWPTQRLADAAQSLTSRGAATTGIAPFIASNRTLSWSPIGGADEHVVEVFNDAGMPVGAAKGEASPYSLPELAEATWVRIAAKKDGRVLAHSAYLRIPH